MHCLDSLANSLTLLPGNLMHCLDSLANSLILLNIHKLRNKEEQQLLPTTTALSMLADLTSATGEQSFPRACSYLQWMLKPFLLKTTRAS